MVAISTALAIGLATAGAGLAGAAISANANKSASRDATNTANANNDLAREIYSQNAERLDPYASAGTHANSYIQELLGMGSDPAAADAAFQRFLDSSGYQFQVGEGTRAIASTNAVKGQLKSGATLKALDNYGQNQGRAYFNTYLGQVGDVANRGMGAASALAGVGQNYVGQVTANNNAAAETRGQAGIATAGAIGSAFNSGAGAIGYGIGQSSYKPTSIAAGSGYGIGKIPTK